MAWIESIFRKGKKKVDELPHLYNAFFQFNHEDIIQQSKSSDKILEGSEISSTLNLEGEIEKSSVGILAAGVYGCKILSVFKSRFTQNIPDSLILSVSSDYEKLNVQLPFIELPSKSEEELTFYQGKVWWEQNKERSKSDLDRMSRNKSIIYIFPENNAFVLGVINGILEYLKEKDSQIILVSHLPDSKEEYKEKLTILAFIYNILRKNSNVNFPFILIDNSILIKENSNLPSERLHSLILDRTANAIVDLIIGSNLSSTFYQIDSSNFVRIFKDSKGPCRLLSLDIYDNNPDIASMLEKKLPLESYKDKSKSTRGFLLIQPGPEGLKTKEYRKLRTLYSNTDVAISILPNRGNGAIFRGLFTYNELPKALLNNFTDLSDIVVHEVDENNSHLSTVDLSNLERIFEVERYKIVLPDKPQKKKSRFSSVPPVEP